MVQKFLIAFPSSYLAERGFSEVANLLSKKRNLLHVTERGDLRLFLTNFHPSHNFLFSLCKSKINNFTNTFDGA